MLVMLGKYDGLATARRAREFLAGELGARYNSVDDAYTYERDGVPRRLLIRKEGVAYFTLYVEVRGVEG